LKYLYEIAP